MELVSGLDKSHRAKLKSKKFMLATGLLMLVIIGLGVYLLSKPNATPLASNHKTVTTPAFSTNTPKVQLTLFATGLPSPTGIVSTNRANDHRLFVIDQSGIIRIIDQDGSILPKPFLDISGLVTFSGEMGLLGLAFSPHYAQNGYFFVNYIDKNQTTVIARYHVSTDANSADLTSGQTLLTLQQPYVNHNGGDLLFGPDGYLYAALGDGGDGGDPQDRAQNLGTLFGKILRLDVSQVPYKIPVTNPFVNQAGAAPEIWDYGLRNPWRVSFDSKTGNLYIADVGQGDREEINVEAANAKGGNNYGWRCFEGTNDFNPAACKPRNNYVFPVLEYDHTEGRCSITGGYVYRGSKYPSLTGKYFYADLCGGQIYWAGRQNGQWKSTLAVNTPYKISVFGEDNQGELYLGDYSTGAIYRIQAPAD